jgi:hypothetical protein
MNATRQLLVDRGVTAGIGDFETFWSDFSAYVLNKHATGASRDSLLGTVSAKLHFNIPAWLAQTELQDPAAWRMPMARQAEFRLSTDARRELDAALAVWSFQIKGLTKMVTRINVDWQVRRCSWVDETDERATRIASWHLAQSASA